MVFNFDVRAIWRRTPLFYVTILATLCIKGLRSGPCSVQFSSVQMKLDECWKQPLLYSPTAIEYFHCHWTRDIRYARDRSSQLKTRRYCVHCCQCSRIRILRFFQVSKNMTFYGFFKWRVGGGIIRRQRSSNRWAQEIRLELQSTMAVPGSPASIVVEEMICLPQIILSTTVNLHLKADSFPTYSGAFAFKSVTE